MTEDDLIDQASIDRILAMRAETLARPLTAQAPERATKYLLLRLGKERYGIQLGFASEIRPIGIVTFLPGVPAFYAGLANLRGRLYPVLDLGRYLALPDTSVSDSGKLVLVSAGDLALCLRVDDVLGVRSVADGEIESPVEAPAGRQAALAGVTQDLLSILDLERLLSDPQLIVKQAPEGE